MEAVQALVVGFQTTDTFPMSLAVILDSQSLADHVGVIKRQIRRSLQSPETERLARRIINAQPDGVIDGVPYVYAWGLEHQLAESGGALEKATSQLAQIRAIWNFAVLNVAYVPDGIVGNTPEVVQTAELTLDSRRGDCDDYVILLSALLQPLGFKTAASVISADSETNWQHIYTLVEYKGRWVPLDPVVPGATPGYEYQDAIAYEEFPL